METVYKKKFETISLLFIQLRPKQWTKNLLIFAAPIFSLKIVTLLSFIQSVVGFFLFCFVSGCVYILNDFMDREADSMHPIKKHRPMASGRLNPYMAICFGLFLLIGSLIGSYILNPFFMLLLLAYFILNLLYSLKLKHVVIMDIMIIAMGFVFRAIGGGIVIQVPFTPWFLLCTMLISLFLAISKRRHELLLLNKDKGTHRKVLESYSSQLLDQLNTIVATSTIISYSLFTFFSGRTIQLMWTIPLVIYGIFRYLYLIHMEDKGGSPEKVLFEDRHILVTVGLYAITVFMILYFFD
ncbi:4-hydroxybenzoate polyprenyltransferase [Oikeobacillus pervagus]|uniref:4-hydroxybenzoate polyprenyltransferase n=1 Tax=Oikeobacillus pervagus TaxID=1325931 RepID=A0AAJ1T5U3_9BACI|nr:decaprenyl-phosphate phosphoribosyltransferase [Oikeobacillus pervagus]MDQ0215255.1 4-hydroxybenzoate polyprenyltransferase [Oikeobacillus pervagus]